MSKPTYEELVDALRTAVYPIEHAQCECRYGYEPEDEYECSNCFSRRQIKDILGRLDESEKEEVKGS